MFWFLVLLIHILLGAFHMVTCGLLFLNFDIILVALLCTLSSISIFFLRYGLHACIQYSKWGLTIVLYSGIISSFSLYTIFRLINPNIWIIFTAAIPHSSDTFMSALIVNPKSFSLKVVFSTVPPIVYCPSSFPCPVWRHLHFPKLNSICHFSEHSGNLLRSSCKCCLSASLLIFLNTFVSSTNFNTLLVMSSSKSLLYIKNKN